MSANAPPGVGLQVGLATNQLDRVLTHAHPSLAFRNIKATASGYDQQQQNRSRRKRNGDGGVLQMGSSILKSIGPDVSKRSDRNA